MPVTVLYEGKSYSLTPKPMWNVETIIQNALDIARVNNVDAHSCKLVYQGEELEKDVPFRFLNLPSVAKVTLVTGKERVYGIQSTNDHSVAPHRTTHARPKTVVNQNRVGVVQKECASTSEGTSLSLEGVYLFHSVEEMALRGSQKQYHEEIDYEVNEKDAYTIQASLSKQVAPAHLRTKKMRENELERKMERMRPVLVRIGQLRRGIWNNTWKNWGYIALAFLFIYAIEAGFFAGLLFASKRIREQTYRALPSQYFGDFIRTANVYEQPAGLPTDFNPPENCVEGEEPVPGFPDVTQPDGIQTCFPSKGQLGWVIFPWVQDSAGLDTFPGCTATPNATIITYQSNPAFTGDGIAQGDWESQICQNFLLTSAFVGNATQA